VASLVLALLFFVPLAPLVGLILGIIAIVKISASKGAMKGLGLAIAGVVVGKRGQIPFITDGARNGGELRVFMMRS